MKQVTTPASVLQAVSDPTRLRLLRLLCREELNVRELVKILEMNQPRVSKHLAVLRDAGWVRQRKEGTWSWYRAVTKESFSGGEDLFAGVAAAADQVAAAREDEIALAIVLSERSANARDFFAGVAGRWERIRRSYEHPDIQLAAVGALVDDRLSVLDIGTGTGALLPLLAGAVGSVVAVDQSQAMLARAQALCQASGLDEVQFHCGDIQALPFADGSFHAATCSMVLHHVARPAVAVAEMARVVRPGGKVIVIAFTRHNLTWLRDELAHRWPGFAREEIEELFADAGLLPQRYLVRRRTEDETAPAGPTAGESTERLNWPDVFLAVAEKPAA